MVAASAGNHAQGVALAAQLLGIQATVFMPEGAPIPKERATRAYGADVVFEGSVLEEALAAAPTLRRGDRSGADPPLRPRRHRRRAGHLRSGGARAGTRRAAPCWCRPAAAGSSPGSRSRSRRSAPTCAWWAYRRPAPRRTRTRWRTGRRCRSPSMRTMADGIAVGPAGRDPVRRGAQPRRRDRHRLRGVDLAGPAGAGRAGQDGRRARRRRRRGGAAGRTATLHRPRRSRCSPAATSTRCCSAR